MSFTFYNAVKISVIATPKPKIEDRADVVKSESPTNDNNSEAEADQNVLADSPSSPLCESTHIGEEPAVSVQKTLDQSDILNHSETLHGKSLYTILYLLIDLGDFFFSFGCCNESS